MKSLKQFFNVQMGLDVCPPAKEKLFKKMLPELCIEYDICPLCGGDLTVTDDADSGSFINSVKKCKECSGRFKGEKSYGRPHIQSKTFIPSG